ncbi:MAG TPA: metallophosphoesterase [Kofleriaceae bacterium]|nr:metallophosphoesterase [Kofleriaceae bacterium]
MSERAYVIGDLHLGAGNDDPLEDFRDDDVFARFCERIAGPETTLLLNGDIVDFAQIAPFEVPKAAYLLWPEPASMQKLETALAAHPDFFAGLRALVAKGSRVRFLVGNHDLDMVFERVKHRMWEALGAPPSGQLSYDVGHHVFHGVHVEHGHHWTPENCPRVPLEFCYEGPGNQLYLERVWGTDFMLQFYNDLERTHPYADNVKPMLTVAYHGLRQGWIGGRTLARFFLFLKSRLGAPGMSALPWTGILGALLDGDAPPLRPNAAVAAFDDPSWRKVVKDRLADPTFARELEEGLAELEPEERKLASAPTKVAADEPTLGTGGASAGGAAPATLGLFREDRELRAARDRLAAPGITHVVFGHTHAVVDGELDGRLFNYGTWLPSLDLKSPHVAAKIAASGLTLDMLKDSSLYVADRRAVRIDTDPSGYQAQVRLVPHDAP